jgi:hypothetical protein
MWKPEHRRVAERRGVRYPSDLTDAESVSSAALATDALSRSMLRAAIPRARPKDNFCMIPPSAIQLSSLKVVPNRG